MGGGGRVEHIKIFIGSDKNGLTDYIRATVKVKQFGDKLRESRLRWFGLYKGERWFK